jgi:predicted nucleotidyltransferase
MNIDEQIKKTKQVIDERLTDLIDCNEFDIRKPITYIRITKRTYT